MRFAFICAALALTGCAKAAGSHEGKATAWQGGDTVSVDGARFRILCLNGEWSVSVHTVERLVPPNSPRQWVNRDVAFQFDNEPAQPTKGTLNENRLDFNQTEEGSSVNLNYGQDIAAGLMRGARKTLTVSTLDGQNRPKKWVFDVAGSSSAIPNDTNFPCPSVGQKAP
jgi:hypothetical protein